MALLSLQRIAGQGSDQHLELLHVPCQLVVLLGGALLGGCLPAGPRQLEEVCQDKDWGAWSSRTASLHAFKV